MVVFEIKKPQPLPGEPKPIPRGVAAAVPVTQVRAIDRLLLRREWGREHEGERRETAAPAEARTERAIRQLVAQINTHLAARAIKLRLVVVRAGEEYGLEIYDLSGEDACRSVADLHLEISELPAFLRHLQAETGILVDTQT